MDHTLISNPVSSRLSIGDDAAVTTFHETKRLVFKVAHKLADQYGAPYEEVEAQALLIFMRAYRQYPKVKAKCGIRFTTRLYRSLHWCLIDWLRDEARRGISLELNEEVVGSTAPTPGAFADLEALLSHEARTVIRLILRCPEDLADNLVLDRATGRRAIKDQLRRYLRDELGWDEQEITLTFDELRFALSHR